MVERRVAGTKTSAVDAERSRRRESSQLTSSNGNGNGNENISNAPPTVDRRRIT